MGIGLCWISWNILTMTPNIGPVTQKWLNFFAGYDQTLIKFILNPNGVSIDLVVTHF